MDVECKTCSADEWNVPCGEWVVPWAATAAAPAEAAGVGFLWGGGMLGTAGGRLAPRHRRLAVCRDRACVLRHIKSKYQTLCRNTHTMETLYIGWLEFGNYHARGHEVIIGPSTQPHIIMGGEALHLHFFYFLKCTCESRIYWPYLYSSSFLITETYFYFATFSDVPPINVK